MTLFSPLIEQAVALAAQWHDGTYRKSRWRAPAYAPPDGSVPPLPVMTHVTAVALIVQQAGWDEAVVAAAFLHDVLEDPNRYKQTFRPEELRRQMGEAVAGLVEAVSEQKVDAEGNKRSWRDRKEGYIARLRDSTPEAVAISLADKLHNLWSMNETLLSGIDVFTDGPHRKAFSAGPEAQRWFFKAVLAASRVHSDPRLEPMRARLTEEIDRFCTLIGLPQEESDEG